MGALSTMVRIHLHTGWKAVLVWVLAIAGTMEFTTASIKGLYDTPEKVHSYAVAAAGEAMVMLNGTIAGLDSLGGVIANEFGFLASFAIPFMAVNLVARMTRGNEESGRLDAVLAGRIGRGTPLAAAVVVATAAQVLTAGALFASFAGVGVPTTAATLYAVSMGLLGLTFVGISAVSAQLVLRSRGVHAIGLGTIIAAYLLRGAGDVQWAPLTWLSPLGWQEQTRAFGDQQWWPLLVPVAVSGLLVWFALRVSRHRDVGSALLRPGPAEPTASDLLRSPFGIAARTHRGSLIIWATATLAVAATFGALTQPLIDAIEGNPALATALGGSGTSGLGSVLAMTALLLALLSAGYGVQAIGVLRTEETSGRLETRLSGDRTRWSWLTVHLVVIALGLAVVSVTGAAALAATASWSVRENTAGEVFRGTVDFLPAVILYVGIAVLLFAVLPRWQPVAWAIYALGAVVALLGDPLDLAEPVLALSALHLIGSPPAEAVDSAAVVTLALVAAACVAAAYAAFRRRGIPQG